MLGIFSALAGGGVALLIENDPAHRGLAPDGDPLPADAPVARRHGLSVREAAGTGRFAGLYAACLIASFGAFVPFVHLVPYAVGHGIRPDVAAALLGAIGVGSTAGRFALGGLADRMGRRASLFAMYAGMAASLAIWAVSGDVWSLASFALLYGVFYGGWVAVLPAVVMDEFGGRHVAGIIGVLYTSVAFGTLIGPSTAGFAFDATHSYLPAILGSAGANLLAALITLAMARSSVAAASHA